MTILGTNHVGFTVADIDRGIAMFRDLFGYELISLAPRPPQNVTALTGVKDADIVVAHLRKAGLVGIELIAYKAPADRGRISARPCDTGYAHITFDVSDLDDIIERGQAFGLVPIGVEIASTAGPNKGARAIYLKDAEGISIELIQPPSLSTSAG